MNAPRAGLFVFFVLCCGAYGTAQNRPLSTETVDTVPLGKIRAELGFEFLQDVTFNLSGLEGDLTNVGLLGIRSGVGRKAEVFLFWTAQRFLNVDRRFPAPNSDVVDFAGNSTSDIGDLVLGTKLRLVDESGARPSIGTTFSVQVPNGSSESGINNDEANVFSSLLLQKKIGRMTFLTNLGLAILGDPLSPGAQDDLFLYGVALIYPLDGELSLVADWNGRAGSGGIGTEESSTLRLGAQVNAAGLYWDAAFVAGFKDTDPRTGLVVGLSKDFDFPGLK